MLGFKCRLELVNPQTWGNNLSYKLKAISYRQSYQHSAVLCAEEGPLTDGLGLSGGGRIKEESWSRYCMYNNKSYCSLLFV